MQIMTSKENLYINKVIGEKTDTVIVEEDFVVPDVKPDILSSIHTNGTVCIYKKEVMDGRIKIEGCINTYIIYLADDENSSIRSINQNLDFSEIIEFDSVKEGMMLESCINLKTIECRVINGRKINIKAMLDIKIKVLSNEEVEFVSAVDNCKDIQILNENINLNSLLGSSNTRVYAKDTIMLDSIDNLSEILKVDIKVINKEIKVSYNKILVKADACSKIIYLTDDGRICKTSQLIPVMGFTDMQDITDDDICDVNFEIKNLIVKPNNMEEHSIYIEIELEVNCNSYKTKQVNLIQDLYSPTINLNYNQKQINTMSNKKMVRDIYQFDQNQVIPEIGNNKLYDVEVKPIIINQTPLIDKIVYEGELALNFLYESNSGRNFEVKTIIVPFNYNMNCPGITKNTEIETTIDVNSEDFTVKSDESIDINIELGFNVSMRNTRTINVIEEINTDEVRNDDRHSLVIYFVKPGDTLWNIAKRFHSTINNIVEANQIEDKNKLKVGEQLFIPISV